MFYPFSLRVLEVGERHEWTFKRPILLVDYFISIPNTEKFIRCYWVWVRAIAQAIRSQRLLIRMLSYFFIYSHASVFRFFNTNAYEFNIHVEIFLKNYQNIFFKKIPK